MSDTRWILQPETEAATQLSDQLGIPSSIARILANRGITRPDEAQAFLHGTLEDLHDPYLLTGMRAAVERIRGAIRKHEKILIFGDYDVDGVLSVVILTRALRSLGADVEYYIPNRLLEGYGLKDRHLSLVQEKQARVVISVDCGIKAIDFVRSAQKSGIDVIITDHHQPGPQLPDALAVLNPALPSSGYPDPHLAGIGVVFKLIQALFADSEKAALIPHYLKLVSIGTVADVAPLRSENRLFVKYGLKGLESVANAGLNSLLDVCGLNGKTIRVGDVAFRIGPRINAAGRLGEADLSVRLFFADSQEEAMIVARRLNEMNADRQAIEKKIFEGALTQVRDRELHRRYRLLILGCEEWHRGVIGIVASKLKDIYHRPVILFTYENGKAYGSGRSIKGFPLISCLDENKALFNNYGGHPMAVGCELLCEGMPGLKRALNRYAAAHISDEDLKRRIKIDTVLPFAEIDTVLLELLEMVSPFGVGNPKPVFITPGVEVIRQPMLMKDRHIKMLVRHSDRVFEAIGWDKGEWIDTAFKGTRFDIVFTLQTSDYLGEERLNLNLEDIKPSA